MISYFDVSYRGNNHWDIYDREKRICKIRGEAGNYSVINDYGYIVNKEGFATPADALKYIAEQLMAEV